MQGRSASQLAGAPQGREKERMSLPTWAPPKPGVGWAESEAGPGQAAPQGCSKEGGPLSSVEFPFPRSTCPHVSDNKVRKPHVCWSDGKGPPPTQLSGDFRIPKFPGSAAVGICLPLRPQVCLSPWLFRETKGIKHLVAFVLSVTELCPALLRPHGPMPARLLCPWDSPGKNTGVGSHFLPHGSLQPRDRTCVSCIGRQILYC